LVESRDVMVIIALVIAILSFMWVLSIDERISVFDFSIRHAEMDMGDINLTIPIGAANVWYTVTNFTGGELDGFTLVDNRSLVVSESGLFVVNHAESFSDGLNVEYELTIAVNNVTVDGCHARRKLGASGDIGNSGGTCIINLSSSDGVTMVVRNLDSAADPTFNDVAVTLSEVGSYSVSGEVVEPSFSDDLDWVLLTQKLNSTGDIDENISLPGGGYIEFNGTHVIVGQR